MCVTQYALLIALYVGLAHSWDIAISLGDRLEFYTNDIKTDTVYFKSHNPTAIAYDEVHNMILFVDKQRDNDAICGYNLTSKNTRCFLKRYGSNIKDIAFDPATDLLFFIDAEESSIYWISLKNQESENNVYHESLFVKFDNQTVNNIAIDSCRGYIYWTYVFRMPGLYMERARLNGSKRKVIYEYLPIYSFTIDPQTHTNYFIDGAEFINMEFLRKADLKKKYINGEADIIYNYEKHPFPPKELTVTNDYLYWMNSSESDTTIWKRPKTEPLHPRVEPREVCTFYNEKPHGIAANYKIRQQMQGVRNCEALSTLIPIITAATTDYITEIEQTAESEQTVGTEQTEEPELTEETEGMWLPLSILLAAETNQTKKGEEETKYATEITPSSIGEQYYVSVCENYCLQGNCTVNYEGLPECSCYAGYSGKRCEVNLCYGYCLHNADCILNEEGNPHCRCKDNYIGARCEVFGCLNYCLNRGSCEFIHGYPLCRCIAGYFGERCEVGASHGYSRNGDCTLKAEDGKVAWQSLGDHEGSTVYETVNYDTYTKTFLYNTANENLTLTDLQITLRYKRN